MQYLINKNARSKPMEYAIIAAGEGSRLKKEGLLLPKPMVMLDGLPIIHRLINIFIENNATCIHIIINDFSPELSHYLQEVKSTIPVKLNIIIKTTASSLHSFHEIIQHVKGDNICLTTVDTVFESAVFSRYIHAFLHQEIDALMAVTSFIDDEKPLYAATDMQLNITAFLDEKTNGAKYVSGGIYCLNKNVFKIVEKAVASGVSRMRNLQRLFITEGCTVKAFPFAKIIDIDHVSDIAKAERWLEEIKLEA